MLPIPGRVNDDDDLSSERQAGNYLPVPSSTSVSSSIAHRNLVLPILRFDLRKGGSSEACVAGEAIAVRLCSYRAVDNHTTGHGSQANYIVFVKADTRRSDPEAFLLSFASNSSSAI